MIESLKEMAERLEWDQNRYLPQDKHIAIALTGYKLEKFKGIDRSKKWEECKIDGAQILLRFLDENFHTAFLKPRLIYVGEDYAVVYMQESSKEELMLDAMYELNAIYSDFLEKETGELAPYAFHLRPIITQFDAEAAGYFSHYRDENGNSVSRYVARKQPLPPEVEYGFLRMKKKQVDERYNPDQNTTTVSFSYIDVDSPADGSSEEFRSRVLDAIEYIEIDKKREKWADGH